MSIKHGSMPVLALQTPMEEPSTRNLVSLPFPRVFGSWQLGLHSIPALRSVWNRRGNTGFRCSISLRNPALLPLPIPSTPSLRREIKPIARTLSGSATYCFKLTPKAQFNATNSRILYILRNDIPQLCRGICIGDAYTALLVCLQNVIASLNGQQI